MNRKKYFLLAFSLLVMCVAAGMLCFDQVTAVTAEAQTQNSPEAVDPATIEAANAKALEEKRQEEAKKVDEQALEEIFANLKEGIPVEKSELMKRQDELTSRSTRKLTMKSTAYHKSTCGKDEGDPEYGITAKGKNLVRGIVAVDPDVIPLGTHLYIPGYGCAVAGDTGGAIKGYKIDLSFDTLDEAWNWKNPIVEVYIL
jgi:3D (Asp-Asp-Asp) domain-containing protein